MLRDKGHLGIITSNAWLGTSASEAFYYNLIERCNLLQVHLVDLEDGFKMQM